MPTFRIAHLHEQGNDMIIVPLDPSFGNQAPIEQQRIVAELQMRARAAGLAGTVVPIWDTGGGRMTFMAPHQWHPFFRSIDFRWVAQNLNKNLSW